MQRLHLSQMPIPVPAGQMMADPPTVEQLIRDDARMEKDLRRIQRYVKEELFQKVVFLFNPKKQMECGSQLYNDFIANCKALIAQTGEADDTMDAYMRYLWQVMAQKKSYKEWLTAKRSNAYQAVQDKFLSK